MRRDLSIRHRIRLTLGHPTDKTCDKSIRSLRGPFSCNSHLHVRLLHVPDIMLDAHTDLIVSWACNPTEMVGQQRRPTSILEHRVSSQIHPLPRGRTESLLSSCSRHLVQARVGRCQSHSSTPERCSPLDRSRGWTASLRRLRPRYTRDTPADVSGPACCTYTAPLFGSTGHDLGRVHFPR